MYPNLMYADALAKCTSDGSTLYAVDTLDKRTLLLQYLLDITFGSGNTFLVGLTKTNGEWRWPNNSTGVFYWNPDDPMPIGNECTRFSNHDKYIISDYCSTNQQFLCEANVSI
ncbi:hypothetical protein SNE40_014462 [Patella caerulea]|uniref:C-type lectin domain-containing protein n=1 Tax=Patella caerulea TaxID=87958 RepID=A0AAN8JI18_PATCE